MNNYWYRLIVKKKSDMETVRNFLASSSYPYYDLQKLASNHPNIQNLVKRFFTGSIFIQIPEEEELTSLLEKAPVKLQVKKNNHAYNSYQQKEVENIVTFLEDFEGLFTIVTSIPQNTEARELGTLGNPHHLRGFLYKATGNSNRFYVKLADIVSICFPVSKRQELITERRQVPTENTIRERWYVIRTRQEEEWQKQLEDWKRKHQADIESKTLQECTTYLPFVFRKNALGQLVRTPVFRGLLFIKTNLRNLQLIQQEQLPDLEKSLMKTRNTFIKDPKASKYVLIDEQSMNTFMLVNDNYSHLVEYESFDFKDNEKVRYFHPGHPLNGQVGTLQHKGKKLYITFGLTNVTGNFRVPAIEVKTIELQKIQPENPGDTHS